MDSKRHYDEDEARRIFAIATRGNSDGASDVRTDRGLTLAELQEIGSEAGIHPERVADAARGMDARPARAPRITSLGIQVSAGELVSLPRRPTETEWCTVVARCRDLFEAPGEVRDHGDAREWSNGALRVLLEPTTNGYQLRFVTVNRRFRFLNRIGALLAVVGLTFLGVGAPGAVAASGGVLDVLQTLLPSLLVAGGGLGFVAYGALRLPGWVATREAQFERLSEDVRSLLDAPAEDVSVE